MFYYGEHNVQLDEKNRMRIPMKLRVLLGAEFYILNGSNGCLFIMDAARFNAMTEKFAAIPLTDLAAREAVGEIMSSVVVPDEDGQGRFVLPARAKLYAGIDKKIVVAGACDVIQIWSEENYLSRGYGVPKDFNEKLQALKEYGI